MIHNNLLNTEKGIIITIYKNHKIIIVKCIFKKLHKQPYVIYTLLCYFIGIFDSIKNIHIKAKKIKINYLHIMLCYYILK